MTLLHTNDLHGHIDSWQGWEKDLEGKEIGGIARIAGAVSDVRQQVGEKNVLLLDGGDTLGDTMIADLTKGKAVTDALNLMRYDAMVIGNHEPDFTAEVLSQRMAEARFPMLGANRLLADGGHRYITFLRGRDRKELEPQYEIIKDVIKTRGTINPPSPGRIEKK